MASITSTEKQMTIKVCKCCSDYFDKDVSASLIDFFSRDFDSIISRISDEIILKYCHNCLKGKFVRKIHP